MIVFLLTSLYCYNVSFVKQKNLTFVKMYYFWKCRKMPHTQGAFRTNIVDKSQCHLIDTNTSFEEALAELLQ